MIFCGADAPRAFQNQIIPVDITREQLEELLSLRETENLHHLFAKNQCVVAFRYFD